MTIKNEGGARHSVTMGSVVNIDAFRFRPQMSYIDSDITVFVSATECGQDLTLGPMGLHAQNRTEKFQLTFDWDLTPEGLETSAFWSELRFLRYYLKAKTINIRITGFYRSCAMNDRPMELDENLERMILCVKAAESLADDIATREPGLRIAIVAEEAGGDWVSCDW